jgi:hypothetical protein
LLALLFRRVYSVEDKTSEAQLGEDFGEFPPLPLRCQNLSGRFSIIRVRGIGEAYQDIQLIRSVWEAIDADDIESLSTDMRAQIDVESILELSREIRAFTRESILLRVIFSSMVYGFLFIKMVIGDIRKGRNRYTVLGLFVPVKKYESRIIIRSGRHLKRSDAPTISHEHIHLLQHKSQEKHRRNVNSPEALICDDRMADSFVNYIFEKDEVEARLHELVVSFYRIHRQLPVTVPGFFGLLAASENIGGLVEDTLDGNGAFFDRDLAAYPPREEEWVKQLALILISIRTPELQFRFIAEVLSVMYGNLLYYYGENVTEYQATIQRPNLYDELYGER